MTDFDIENSLESHLEFLAPLLSDKAGSLAKKYSVTSKFDLTSSEWFFISDERTKSDFCNPFVFEKAQHEFQAFFKQNKVLYHFIELPILGMVNKPAKFWVFFIPKMAANYFLKQAERPRNFGPSVIKRFPFVDLQVGFVKGIQSIVNKTDERPIYKIKKIEELLDLSDYYQKTEEADKFNQISKRLVISIALIEIKSLITDIVNSGVTPTLLEKRLSSLYRVCVHLYAASDEEKELMKKLLSPKIVVRKKALEIIAVKLSKDSN